MATATNTTRFDNYSSAMLADAYGRAKALADAAQAEVDVIKEEIKRRGETALQGDDFSVSVTETMTARADTKALKAFLGSDYSRFEMPVISNVIRVKAVAAARVQLAA